jgi:hypothetical protein
MQLAGCMALNIKQRHLLENMIVLAVCIQNIYAAQENGSHRSMDVDAVCQRGRSTTRNVGQLMMVLDLTTMTSHGRVIRDEDDRVQSACKPEKDVRLDSNARPSGATVAGGIHDQNRAALKLHTQEGSCTSVHEIEMERNKKRGTRVLTSGISRRPWPMGVSTA